MQDRFIKRLVASMKCSVCGERYEADHVNVLGRQQDLWFLSVRCSSCRTQVLVAAVVKQDQTPEVVGELSREEQVKFSQMPPVNEDDLLSLHSFLKDYHGDFSRLFSENSR